MDIQYFYCWKFFLKLRFYVNVFIFYSTHWFPIQWAKCLLEISGLYFGSYVKFIGQPCGLIFLKMVLSLSDSQLCPWSRKNNCWSDLVVQWLGFPGRMLFSSWITVPRSWNWNCGKLYWRKDCFSYRDERQEAPQFSTSRTIPFWRIRRPCPGIRIWRKWFQPLGLLRFSTPYHHLANDVVRNLLSFYDCFDAAKYTWDLSSGGRESWHALILRLSFLLPSFCLENAAYYENERKSVF